MAIDHESLEKTQKVLTFGAPQNNKTYPVRIIVWDKDKQPPSPKQVTCQVEIKDGEGKLPSDMYKHVGMGAKIKVDGKLVTLESKKSENFDITFSHNRFNIIGKRELSQDNSRQSEQDLIAQVNELIDSDRKEALNKRHLVARMMQRMQDLTLQRSSKTATAALSANLLPTGKITPEKMISMEVQHEKIDNFMEQMEMIEKKACEECNKLYEDNAKKNIDEIDRETDNDAEKKSGVSKQMFNTIMESSSEDLQNNFRDDYQQTPLNDFTNNYLDFSGINQDLTTKINEGLKNENPDKQMPVVIFDPSPIFNRSDNQSSIKNPKISPAPIQEKDSPVLSPSDSLIEEVQPDADQMTHRERHKLFKEGFVDKQVTNHHQHHNSNIDQFADLLEDKLEEFAQSQTEMVDIFKKNYDACLKKEYFFHTRFFREEMRKKLNDKSKALISDKSLTPEERKKKLLEEHEKIKKQQQKELAKIIKRINVRYARYYTELLVNIAKSNEAFANSLKNYQPKEHDHEHDHDHIPILGPETAEAFAHLQNDKAEAVKKAKKTYSLLQQANKLDEADMVAKQTKNILGVDITNEADRSQDQSHENAKDNFTQSTVLVVNDHKLEKFDEKSGDSKTQPKKPSPFARNDYFSEFLASANSETLKKIEEKSGFALPSTGQLADLLAKSYQALRAQETSKEDAQQKESKLRSRSRGSLDIEAMTKQNPSSQFKGA